MTVEESHTVLETSYDSSPLLSSTHHSENNCSGCDISSCCAVFMRANACLPVEDWGKLLGDAAAVSAMLDRLLHHGHVLKCGPRSWRTKAAAGGGEQLAAQEHSTVK